MSIRLANPASPTPHRIGVALQGGGSHGAFTWGVLDRLLQEPKCKIDSITGTSAGAMNAVALADGLIRNGTEGARETLREFWEAVGDLPGLAMFSAPGGHVGNTWHLDHSPAYIWFDLVSRIWSPYDLNPLNYNPLRGVLEKTIDFERLRHQDDVRVMICATNVRTGRRRIFEKADISIDAVLASACLPYVYPAVEIDGEPYWDGGYTGNPAIGPMLSELPVEDLIIIGINPLVREETPRHARDIINRVNEISFNSTVWLELTALAVIQDMLDEGYLESARFPKVNFHGIDAGRALAKLGASSKMNNSRAFIEYLYGMGREMADKWLEENLDAIGHHSTVDLKQLLPEGFSLSHRIRGGAAGHKDEGIGGSRSARRTGT